MSATRASATVKRLGVAGWPVAHSRSPEMQNAALHAVGIADSWYYQRLPLPPELFEDTVRALPASGFRGINVTIPHKASALAISDVASERARAIGAANTLLFGPDGQISADNTDAPALVSAVDDRLEGGIAGRTAMIVGAGGSARAAVWGLLNAGAAAVRVWNRTHERAQRICAELGAEPVTEITSADVIVNCTVVGLDARQTLDELPIDEHLFKQARLVVDFVYGGSATPFGQAAVSAGVPCIDGLELLVRQGAESFTQFTGIPAPIEVMRTAVTSGHRARPQ